MKLHIASLAILCVALVSVPAFAQQWAYDNGPINGTINAWAINYGYVTSDTFTAGYGWYDQVAGFSFGVWEFPGDVMSSVDWSITTAENGGTVIGSGTASGQYLTDTFLSTMWYGYDIDLITVSGLNVAVNAGTTYWLNLQNAVVPSGDQVWWDENSGVGCGGLNGTGQGCPSQASLSAWGTIPSEAFTISGYYYGPEPSSIMLFGSGILGIAGVLRRKMNF